MKTHPALRTIAFFAAFVVFATGSVRAETAYFLMSGPRPLVGNGAQATDSYVLAVSEPALINQARTYLASGDVALYLVPRVKITLGGDGVNRNHVDVGHPAWNWHVTELIEWTTFDPSLPRAAVYLPSLDSTPSRVASEILGWPEMSLPNGEMSLVWFPLSMELSAVHESAVINVSTRGWVGIGERALIAGFVVEGGVPRNVLIRALGPSLSTFGVVEALADPSLSVYRGTEKIAENDDWKNGNFASSLAPDGAQTAAPPPWYIWLYPTHAKEAAIRLSLAPGAYTVQVGGAGNTGIALVEVYDFDALVRPSPSVELAKVDL